MDNDTERDNNIEVHFLQLVLGLQSSAWMLLGKVANPMTGGVEKNLEAAKATIDTLLMIKKKTRGNLTKPEQDLLGHALQELEINFIEEARKPDIRTNAEDKDKIEKKESISKDNNKNKKKLNNDSKD